MQRAIARANERNSGGGERELGCGSLAMRTTCAAGSGAGAERLIHDFLDGACTSPALGAAAQTSIHLSGRPRRYLRNAHDTTYVTVTQDVAGTNDHGGESSLGEGN